MPYDTLRLPEVFQCKKCGNCCKGFGGTFITAEDIEAISNYIKADPQNFVTDYCQMEKSAHGSLYLSLVKVENVPGAD